MKILPNPQNKAFVPGTAYQFAWDSTSLGELKSCPRRYQYSIIQGYRTKGEILALEFGIAYHKGREIFDQELPLHRDQTRAQIAALRAALSLFGKYTESDDWVYFQGTPYRNAKSLARAIVWSTEDQAHNEFKTWIQPSGKPATEISFRLELYDNFFHNYPLVLCGHFDKIVEYNSKLWIKDHKTTQKTINADYFEQYTPDNQMSLYTLAGHIVLTEPIEGTLVEACQLAVNFCRVKTGMVYRSAGMLEEFQRNIEEFILEAARFSDQNYWPQNDRACYLCNFKQICNKDPSVRQSFLDADFIKTTWDPLTPR